MTVGSFKAKYNTPCMECGANISPGDTAFFVKGQHGYWCGECDQKKVSQTAAQTTPEAARQSSIEQAHKDNMESARQTRDMIALLVTSVNALQKELAVLVTMWREVRAEDKTWAEKQLLKEEGKR